MGDSTFTVGLTATGSLARERDAAGFLAFGGATGLLSSSSSSDSYSLLEAEEDDGGGEWVFFGWGRGRFAFAVTADLFSGLGGVVVISIGSSSAFLLLAGLAGLDLDPAFDWPDRFTGGLVGVGFASDPFFGAGVLFDEAFVFVVLGLSVLAAIVKGFVGEATDFAAAAGGFAAAAGGFAAAFGVVTRALAFAAVGTVWAAFPCSVSSSDKSAAPELLGTGT